MTHITIHGSEEIRGIYIGERWSYVVAVKPRRMPVSFFLSVRASCCSCGPASENVCARRGLLSGWECCLCGAPAVRLSSWASVACQSVRSAVSSLWFEFRLGSLSRYRVFRWGRR